MSEIPDSALLHAIPEQNIFRNNRLRGAMAAVAMWLVLFPLPTGPVEEATKALGKDGDTLANYGEWVAHNTYAGFSYDFDLFSGNTNGNSSASAGP